jgi:hypothetical protein
MRIDDHLGYLELKNLRVLVRGSRIEGYAHVQTSPGRARCGELIATSPSGAEALVRDLERFARGRLLSFHECAASDRRRFLAQRGYRFLTSAWYVLLGASLRRPLSASASVREFGTADPRWVCFDADHF